MMTPMPPPERDAVEEPEIGDRHLRDTSEVTGYYIHAADHDIGHVEDFLIDTDDWTIRYVVVDTRNWWPGRKVLVSPQAFTRIDWDSEMLHTNLTRDQIRNGPDYDPSATVDRAYEERFAGYYGYPNYWV